MASLVEKFNDDKKKGKLAQTGRASAAIRKVTNQPAPKLVDQMKSWVKPTNKSTTATKGPGPIVQANYEGDLPIYKNKEQTEVLKEAWSISDPSRPKGTLDTAGYLSDFRILVENGAPNIKREGREWDDPSTPNKRAYYTPKDNTVHIPYGKWHAKGFSAEVAHAQQYKDQKGGLVRDLMDWVRAPYLNQQVRDVVQYTTPGTIEHEAHEIIEPKLEEQRGTLYNRYMMNRVSGGSWDGLDSKWDGIKGVDIKKLKKK